MRPPIAGETEGVGCERANRKTKHYLTKDEVKAVMARRDNIVGQFQKMIAEKVRTKLLY